jgi:hypothetical protein
MIPGPKGVEAINRMSFGCSAAALGQRLGTYHGFPYDFQPEPSLVAALTQLDAECKKWQQGGNYNPGSAVFCLVTKQQTRAKEVLEANGFEELGRTISSHIWPHDMDDFRKTLDATEVIYLMGKGWYHKPQGDKPDVNA